MKRKGSRLVFLLLALAILITSIFVVKKSRANKSSSKVQSSKGENLRLSPTVSPTVTLKEAPVPKAPTRAPTVPAGSGKPGDAVTSSKPTSVTGAPPPAESPNIFLPLPGTDNTTIDARATPVGCCSHTFLTCDGTWCGDTKQQCENCSSSPSMVWLSNGSLPVGTCLPRWTGCGVSRYGGNCCFGATCRDSGSGWRQCLADSDYPPIGAFGNSSNSASKPTMGPTSAGGLGLTAQPTGSATVSPVPPTAAPLTTARPTGRPTGRPTPRPTSTQGATGPTGRPTGRPTPRPTGRPTPRPTGRPTPRPTARPTPRPTSTQGATGATVGSNNFPPLLRTTNASNAWSVFESLSLLTQNNTGTPPTAGLVADGGAAGSGDVVSESQGYALLITGLVLASWKDQAGLVSGSDRNQVISMFGRYFRFWQKMCQISSNSATNCQSGGYICNDSSRGNISSVCLPDWKVAADGSKTIATGTAPDGDEDAIVGIIIAVRAVEKDTTLPEWYEDARRWADASASAFFTYNVDSTTYPEYALVKLGSCWGGWDNAGNNPSYHSPGSYKIMRDYQSSFPAADRVGYSGIAVSEWNSLISTSYQVLSACQCSGNAAMVPNWATVGVTSGHIVNTGGTFSGSGTPQNEYGSEAARTTFRVAMDAAFHPGNTSDWSGFLSPFLTRLRSGFSFASGLPYWADGSGTFPPGTIPGTNLQVTVFSSWIYNGFIYGPTLSALVSGTSDDADMMAAAGDVLSANLPTSYYSRIWVLLANLMLSGAIEDAGKTLRGQ